MDEIDKQENSVYSLSEEEYNDIVLSFRNFDENSISYFSVRLKDDDRKILMVNKKTFDPSIHVIIENKDTIERRKSNSESIIKSKKAPGFNTSTVRTSGSRGSMFHNHRLDEGAMGDLLDKGLEGAKTRAVDREKKLGKGRAFSRRSYGRRIRNGKGQKR